MEEAPIYLLESFASLEEQRRYISNGSKDEYLLPEELVADALRFCEHFERVDRKEALKSQSQEAVERLREALKALGRLPERYEHANISDLIDNDVGWGVLRDRAKEAIEAFKPVTM